MPLNLSIKMPSTGPKPSTLTLSNWRRGVITLIDKSRIPKDALATANNIFLVEDGNPTPRPGVDWFGTAPGMVSASSHSVSPSASTSASRSLSPSASASGSPSASTSASPSASASASLSPSASVSRSLSPSASTSQSPSSSYSPSASQSRSPSASNSPSASTSGSASLSPSASISALSTSQIDGFDYFDFSGAIHLVVATDGVVYRSTDDATTWTACTGALYTSGTDVNFCQNGNYLYITTGASGDNIIRYDGTTTLSTYTALTTPAAPTVAEAGTLGGAGFNYYYKTCAANTVGFSAASPVGATVVQTNLSRDNWDTTNHATITPAAYQGTQTRADVFISEDNVNFFYLGSTSVDGTVFVDDGTSIPNPAITAPTGNTTQGPKVAELTNVGSRMYGVRDYDNRYRIWFSGAAPFAGAFSSAYDGGYLDWQNGGKYIPMHVEDYRDGKGTPLATIWCKSADGQGCILQMSLDTLTLGNISITVPSAYKLPGSRGTPSPDSVVNVLNDYFFYNSQAFYNLGSRAQFLNLLSTDESSANIRPTIKTITTSAESKIASCYSDARIYFSVPYGSATNNYTAIYDTERKAWLPKAFDIGFKKFLRYTDTTGDSRLLALKPGDTILSEISSDFKGDYGVPFQTTIETGLYPTVKDRFEFQFTEEAEIELSQPVGRIQVTLMGIERRAGYGSVNSQVIENINTQSNTGLDSYGWDTRQWDDTSDASTVLSESSVKRYFTVQKELNAVQWNITTSSLDATYVLRTLQTWGTETQSGKPREWRLT